MRTTWTLYVSNDRPRHAGEESLVYHSQRDALIRMWAEAKRENPRTVWLSAGADGWDSNHHMRVADYPADLTLRAAIRAEVEHLNALDCNEDNAREVTLTLKYQPGSQSFLVSCPQMRHESAAYVNDLGAALTHLYFEYQSRIEAGL